jgi:hypothetical protein
MKFDIIPMSSCSSLWQWIRYIPSVGVEPDQHVHLLPVDQQDSVLPAALPREDGVPAPWVGLRRNLRGGFVTVSSGVDAIGATSLGAATDPA